LLETGKGLAEHGVGTRRRVPLPLACEDAGQHGGRPSDRCRWRGQDCHPRSSDAPRFPVGVL